MQQASSVWIITVGPSAIGQISDKSIAFAVCQTACPDAMAEHSMIAIAV